MKSKGAQPTLVLVGPLPPLYTGPSVHFQMLVEELCEQGIPCAVVNLSSKRFQCNVFEWGRVREYMGILRDYAQKTVFGKKTVYILIAQSRSGFFRDLLMIWFAWFNDHRTVCHLRGGNYDNFYAAQPRWLRWLIRQTLRKVDIILILSERLEAMFDFEPALKPKIRVVPNGLPSEVAAPVEPKTLPGDPSEPIRLLFLSNLIESKGYLDLLEAVHILVGQYGLNVRCNFCGAFVTNPPDDVKVKSIEHGQQLFEDYVREQGLQECVEYRGPVSGAAKIEEFRQAHFFVLPTNYNNEGQPVSIIEAMAYGDVVISTNYRAVPDLVADGVTGRLVPYGQPAAIAQAIADLATSPRQYREMSRAAVERYRRYFTRDAYLARVMPLLRAGATSTANNAVHCERVWGRE